MLFSRRLLRILVLLPVVAAIVLLATLYDHEKGDNLADIGTIPAHRLAAFRPISPLLLCLRYVGHAGRRAMRLRRRLHTADVACEQGGGTIDLLRMWRSRFAYGSASRRGRRTGGRDRGFLPLLADRRETSLARRGCALYHGCPMPLPGTGCACVVTWLARQGARTNIALVQGGV